MTDRVPPFADVIEGIGYVLDLVGVVAITGGIVLACAFVVRGLRARNPGAELFRGFRQDVGRAILLGLELLVAADILRTVAIAPTLENVAVLALIVAVRTFLSFSLEVELYGTWPWRRASEQGRS